VAAGLIVLRAWSDLSNGGQYSILHPDGCTTLIPVPETGRLKGKPPCHMDPTCYRSPCTGKPLAAYMEKSYILHNDPRLDLGFYTGYHAPRGRLPRRLGEGDLVLFAAGLVPEEHVERLGTARASRLYGEVYIVGGLLVEDVVDVSALGWEEALARHPQLAMSPHYWRLNDEPVALVGRGFTLTPPLKAGARGKGGLEPTQQLRRLLGGKAAEAFARSRFRRTRLLNTSPEDVFETLESQGSKIVWRRRRSA
jgi:hypothetical protein